MSDFARRWQRPEIVQAIFDQVSDAIYLFDKNLHLVGVNKSGERLLDLSAGEMLGKACWALFHVTSSDPGEDGPSIPEPSGSLPTGNIGLLLESGSERRVILRSMELFDQSGALEGVIATATDITEGPRAVTPFIEPESHPSPEPIPSGQIRKRNRVVMSKRRIESTAGLLFLIFVAFLVAARYLPPSIARKPDPEEAKREATSRFNGMTPGQHLQQAGLALKPGATPKAIADGLRHLAAIPQNAPEASQAKAMQRDLIRAQNLATVQSLIDSSANGDVRDGIQKLDRANGILSTLTKENSNDKDAARLSGAVQDGAEQLAIRSPEQFASLETKLVDFKWEKGGFGTVMMASFTIRNDSPVNLANPKIHCDHYGDDGVVIDQNTGTAYGVVKAHSTTRIPNVNMGFLSSQIDTPKHSKTECQIVSLKPASESIFGSER